MKKTDIEISDAVVLDHIRIYGVDILDEQLNNGALFGSYYRDYCFFGECSLHVLDHKKAHILLKDSVHKYKRKNKIESLLDDLDINS